MADQQIKSLGLIAKAIANVRFVLNYGKEARDDPQFEWLVRHLFWFLKWMSETLSRSMYYEGNEENDYLVAQQCLYAKDWRPALHSWHYYIAHLNCQQYVVVI